MKTSTHPLLRPAALLACAGLFAVVAAGAAQAQQNTVYIGGASIQLDSRSTELQGPAGTTRPGAFIEVGDADTIVFGYKRALGDNLELDLALGVPPRHKSYGRGILTPFGQISSVKQVAPTLFLNYKFLDPKAQVRPFVGLGLNHTRFTGGKSTPAGDLASGGPTTVSLKSSTGLAWQAGATVRLQDRWSLTGVVGQAKVKSDATATTADPALGTVRRTTTIDFRPTVFALSLGYSF
jgi:outer membrane protein